MLYSVMITATLSFHCRVKKYVKKKTNLQNSKYIKYNQLFYKKNLTYQFIPQSLNFKLFLSSSKKQ